MEGGFLMDLKTLSSLQHPLVKHLVKLRKDSAYREECGTAVMEGIKPLSEVKPHISKLLYTPSLKWFADPFLCQKWEVTESVLHKISGMRSPEGVLAEVRIPPFVVLSHERRVLAFDAVSDPGNLGALLRSALAFGWDAAYFLPGCCDPFNEKALRAARGAHFKLTLSAGSSDGLLSWAKSCDAEALVASLSGEPPDGVVPAFSRLLVLGNEAHGPSSSICGFCRPVAIPMPGDMESLNVAVAGGILLYLLSKRSDS